MDEYIAAFKRKKKTFSNIINDDKKTKVNKFITKVLLSIIFFLLSIIFTNLSDNNLFLYKEYVFSESLPFTKIKSWYEGLFGNVIPGNDVQSKTVFNGKLVYKSIEDYYDGSKLTLTSNALVNNIASGIVVFIGEKENYGNTVIVQGIDGKDIWYGNLENVSVKLYDYLEKESVIGEVAGEELYLVIKKDNEFISYEDYQS